jgi:hypothetical protein
MLILLSILYRLFHQLLVLFAGPQPTTTPHTAARDRGDQELEQSYEVDPSSFAVQITGSMLISLSIMYQPFHQVLFAGGWTRLASNLPTMAEEHGDRADLGPRSDVVASSTFEVPMTESMLISLSILYQTFHGVMALPATSTPYYNRSNQWIRRDVPSMFEVALAITDSGSKLILISIVSTISSTTLSRRSNSK